MLLGAADLVCDCYALLVLLSRLGRHGSIVLMFLFACFTCFTCFDRIFVLAWLRCEDETRDEAAVQKIESGQEVVWEQGVEG